MTYPGKTGFCLMAAAAVALSTAPLHGSSHREAPFIAGMPQVDGTDFYMFRSYGDDTETDKVTLIANYLPLQSPYGGPNYFDLATNALYEIHIDNSGNGQEDITFQFRIRNVVADPQLDIGDEQVSVPLKNIGSIGPMATNTDNVISRQEYTVDVIRGDRRTGQRTSLANPRNGGETFLKPLDYIGDKSFGEMGGYEAYANDHIYNDVDLGNGMRGSFFVGQRQDAFAVNLGEIFDLVNLNPLEDRNTANRNILTDVNVTSFAVEVPTDFLVSGSSNIIGGWTTSSVRQARVINPQPDFDNDRAATVEGGAFTQVSRLGHPLVNEVVIGLKDKDRFNTSQPEDDGQFATYVTHPTLPALLETLFDGVVEAPEVPREDLVAVFLTGVEGLNQPDDVEAAEILRLNTDIAPTLAADQSDLGVLDGDNAGYPNGRRPGDDVVDIALRAVMGALRGDAGEEDGSAPSGDLGFTDGANPRPATDFANFPYLPTPLRGSPNSNGG